MTLLERINRDLREALKGSDKVRVSILRLIKAAMKNREIERQTELTEDDIVDVLGTLAKRGRESIAEYEKAGRTDLADKEAREVAIIHEYLPEPLSVERLNRLIAEAIEESGATSRKDFGKVMKHVMPQVKGRADGKVVNEKVKELLGSIENNEQKS